MALARQLGEGLKESNFTPDQLGKTLMLGIAYGCVTGGMAPLVGTPTNAVFMGIVDELYDIQIGFAQWFKFGLPIGGGLLLLGW